MPDTLAQLKAKREKKQRELNHALAQERAAERRQQVQRRLALGKVVDEIFGESVTPEILRERLAQSVDVTI